MRKLQLLLLVILIIVANSCKEENILHPWGKNVLVGDLGVVTMNSYDKIPGGAVIYYSSTDSRDLQYVKAVYTVGDGKVLESRASKFVNSISIEGFGDVDPKEVKLYCVDKMENVGESTTITIEPGTPSYQLVYESLKLGSTFGGIYIEYDNQHKSNIVIHVETLNDQGYPYEVETFYTNRASGKLFLRNMPTTELPFSVYVSDRWGNTTSKRTEYLTPIQENKLDKLLFSEYKMPTDLACNAWGGRLSYAWNDDFTPELFVHSAGGDDFPVWFTFDLGVTAKLSRYKFYHLFMEEHAFQRGNLKKWEVWGRSDVPTSDEDLEDPWAGWTKLLDCESHKPSGLPVGELSGDDWNYLKNGEDFEFPTDAPAVKFIRFKVLETWGGDDFIHFTEFTFWGNANK